MFQLYVSFSAYYLYISLDELVYVHLSYARRLCFPALFKVALDPT